MRRLLSILSLGLLLASCSKEPGFDYTRIVCQLSDYTVGVGEDPGVVILCLGDGGKRDVYDFSADPLELVFSSSDENVLELKGKGAIIGRKQGFATLQVVSSSKPEYNCSCKITVKRDDMYDLDTPFDRSMAFHCYEKKGFDRQCFDIDSKGNVYSAFSKSNGSRGYLGIMRHGTDGKDSEEMVFYYAAHGDSFSIEESGGDVYVWVPTFGTKSSDGTYGTAQMFCRVKFEPGKKYAPEDLVDNCFYIKDAKDLFISRDKTTGNIAVMCPDTQASGKTHRVRVYPAESLLSAPMKTVTTLSMTRGGDFGPIKTETTGTVKVKVHDISAITPIADFYYNKSTVYGGRVFQGFCYYAGACYFLCDKGNDSRTTATRDMTLTKLNLLGGVMSGPDHIKAVDDTKNIRAAGFCATPDYLEAEGLLFKDDCLYVGALSWNSGASCFNATFKLK